ncbi:hypothetical protein [uncultured Bifidobacterium sp.]|uniref:hypothetical protein n=1 Tax=uncultured Bifidobacterium sp. TaxID=165187 RepID=UPI002593C746|nr:hypothetical protein [uncultured Bifidobacterium sp.]
MSNYFEFYVEERGSDEENSEGVNSVVVRVLTAAIAVTCSIFVEIVYAWVSDESNQEGISLMEACGVKMSQG